MADVRAIRDKYLSAPQHHNEHAAPEPAKGPIHPSGSQFPEPPSGTGNQLPQPTDEGDLPPLRTAGKNDDASSFNDSVTPLPVAVPDDGSQSPEPIAESGNRLRLELFTDVGAWLDGNTLDAPEPTVCSRNDGPSLFYSDAVNGVFGDPQCGKTWLALSAAEEVLKMPGSRVLIADLDHNGTRSTLTRLLELGVGIEVLKNPDRFLHVQPEDARHMSAIVAQMPLWGPTLAIVDSMGELLPMYGAKSNDADDFTLVNREVLVKLANTGACVIYIDHLSKGLESRNHGASGTGAKKRAINGSYIRATLKEQFIPGQGGAAYLSLAKDRHGGVSKHCSRSGAHEPAIGTFTLIQDGDRLAWEIQVPREGEDIPTRKVSGSNVAHWVPKIAELDPPAKSGNDAWKRLGGKKADVLAAYKEYCELEQAA